MPCVLLLRLLIRLMFCLGSLCSKLRACVSAGVLSLLTWGGERIDSLDSKPLRDSMITLPTLAQENSET